VTGVPLPNDRERESRPARSRAWAVKDSVSLAAVTLVAGLVRIISITRPGGVVFDEFYAADACWYVHTSESLCLTDQEITVVHPPLGKWLIGLGIRIFGFGPGGWRIASAVAGTLTVAALYLLARKVLASTFGAVVAAGLLAFDFLHFVLSRTAMLDVFVTGFGVLAFLFLAYDLESPAESSTRGSRLRPWRLAAGLAAGAASATKWSGWPLLVAVLAVTIAREIQVRRQDGTGRAVSRMIRQEGPSLILWLLVVPVLVYVASYAGRLDGSLLAWPWSEGAWLRAFVERQAFMVDFHLGLEAEHPYLSPAWSWLLLKRPVLFFFSEAPKGHYREILAMGNPLVWWPSIPALLYAAWLWVRDRSTRQGLILAGFLASYGPWLILAGERQQTFLYLLLPAVPFMCLALGAAAARIAGSWAGRGGIAAFIVATIAPFLFYYPLLTAVPETYSSWRARILFTDCGQREAGERLKPRTEPGASPAGWCWV
jgi:dolichyl-phosphate-mannose-protein mannosyltransferase